uniref:Uncharacterized protein n=1 Tax=Arundo donax TaxID=35708 RepID=A0A0A9EQ03_ARUDO
MQVKSTVPIPGPWRGFRLQCLNGKLREGRKEIIQKAYRPYVRYGEICMIGKCK